MKRLMAATSLGIVLLGMAPPSALADDGSGSATTAPPMASLTRSGLVIVARVTTARATDTCVRAIRLECGAAVWDYCTTVDGTATLARDFSFLTEAFAAGTRFACA